MGANLRLAVQACSRVVEIHVSVRVEPPVVVGAKRVDGAGRQIVRESRGRTGRMPPADLTGRSRPRLDSIARRAGAIVAAPFYACPYLDPVVHHPAALRRQRTCRAHLRNRLVPDAAARCRLIHGLMGVSRDVMGACASGAAGWRVWYLPIGTRCGSMPCSRSRSPRVALSSSCSSRSSDGCTPPGLETAASASSCAAWSRLSACCRRPSPWVRRYPPSADGLKARHADCPRLDR